MSGPGWTDDIITPRLHLRLIPHKAAHAGLKGDRGKVERLLGAAVQDELIHQPEVLRLVVARLAADPDYGPWGPRAMILKDHRRMVGHIGFHTQPDPHYLHRHARDAVELGYAVFQDEQRQGYAAEALHAMMHWAHASHGVAKFITAIAPHNEASLALIRKFGFDKIGEHLDDVDGLEHIFLRHAPGGDGPRLAPA